MEVWLHFNPSVHIDQHKECSVFLLILGKKTSLKEKLSQSRPSLPFLLLVPLLVSLSLSHFSLSFICSDKWGRLGLRSANVNQLVGRSNVES